MDMVPQWVIRLQQCKTEEHRQTWDILPLSLSSPISAVPMSPLLWFFFFPNHPGEFLFLHIPVSYSPVHSLPHPRGFSVLFIVPGTLSKVRSAARFPRLFCVLRLWISLVSLVSILAVFLARLVNEEEKVSRLHCFLDRSRSRKWVCRGPLVELELTSGAQQFKWLGTDSNLSDEI